MFTHDLAAQATEKCIFFLNQGCLDFEHLAEQALCCETRPDQVVVMSFQD